MKPKTQIERDNEWLDARDYAEYHATHITGEDFDPAKPWATFPPEEREEKESED